MKPMVQRFIAALLLAVPGFAAAYGFLAIKDSLFGLFDPDQPFRWGKFTLGFCSFAAGAAFIGGWIYFRDRKRGYSPSRSRKKRNRP